MIKVKSDTKNMNPVQKMNYFITDVKTNEKFDLKNTEEWKIQIFIMTD